MTLEMPKESIVFLGGILLSSVLIPLSLPVLRRLGVVDLPNARSTHTTAIPRGAGLLVVVTFLTVLGLYCAVAPNVPLEEQGRLEAIFWSVSLLVVVGFLDDMKGIPPSVKLLFQCGSAVILIAAGFVMPLPAIFGELQPYVESAFSLFWFVGVINAVNFIDGSDGLATTLSTLCMLIFVGISRIVPEKLGEATEQLTKTINLLGLAGAGSALPFLLYNVSPARCFLGDSGSTFFGLLLGILGVLTANYHLPLQNEALSSQVGFSYSFLLVPWLVLLVPIADAVRVTAGRVLRKKSPFRPDNRHLHHILHRAGLSPNQLLFLISLAVMITGMMAAIVLRSNRGPFLMIGICVLLFLSLFWFLKSSYRARRFVAVALNRRLLSFMESTQGYENAASFNERFEQELARVKRHNGALSVLVVNTMNTKPGVHHASPLENPAFLENVLRKLRREDIKGRFSSDRLAFLLVETDKELANQVCERIDKLFQSIRQGESADLQVGIGLAAYPEDGASVRNLLQWAEGDALVKKGASRLPAAQGLEASPRGSGAGLPVLPLSLEALPATEAIFGAASSLPAAGNGSGLMAARMSAVNGMELGASPNGSEYVSRAASGADLVASVPGGNGKAPEPAPERSGLSPAGRPNDGDCIPGADSLDGAPRPRWVAPPSPEEILPRAASNGKNWLAK